MQLTKVVRMSLAVAISLLFVLPGAPRALAEDTLRAIDNPGGGKIVYGAGSGTNDPSRGDGRDAARCPPAMG